MSFGNYAGAAAAIAWIAALAPAAASGQETTEPGRAALIEQAQAQKATGLHPFTPGKVEQVLNGIQDTMLSGGIGLHPYFESAYAGGGFTIGAGYGKHVSAYNLVDLRGSITVKGYKRIEAAFLAPRLFDRRGSLTAIGGWRQATKVGFYGIGTDQTSIDDRANYSFKQPYSAAALDFWPTRNLFLLHGGVELSKWDVGPGKGEQPSVDDVYTPQTLPGLGATPTYLHSEATVAIDSRPAPGYARHGTYLGISFHDFRDRDGALGFRRTDYEAIQHVPILRDAWVLSLHGRMQLANAAGDQTIPYFMLPALGGGSSLRGFASWRFRDRNSLLLQAEWRVLANRFLDMALLYDAGRVSDRRNDLTNSLKSDYGIGFRFHGPVATPLRIELVRCNEGFNLVFSSKGSF
jgi:Omp85 superfamily domain